MPEAKSKDLITGHIESLQINYTIMVSTDIKSKFHKVVKTGTQRHGKQLL